MQAARFYNREDVRIESVDVPTLQPDEYRVRVAYAGICGSDLHEYYHGPINCPAGTGEGQTLGHEFSGTVLEAPAGGDLAVGTHVAIEPIYGCNKCPSCKRGRPATCENFEHGIDMYGYTKAGGLATFANLQRKNLHLLPDSIPLWVGALAEPFSVAWHAADQAGATEDSSAFIAGCGPIGLLLIRVLKARGLTRIIATEPNPIRAQMAYESGATLVINPSEDNSSFAPDASFDISFDCAGNNATSNFCLNKTRRGGTFVMVALWHAPATLDMLTLVLREIKLVGTCCFASGVMDKVIEALSTGALSVTGLVTKVLPLEDLVKNGLVTMRGNAQEIKTLIELHKQPGHNAGTVKPS